MQATGRPIVYSTQGVISSGHYLTSMAGMRMLVAGGNAFDALVAAGFAATVVEPIASYSLAAEGVFMLYHPASEDLLSLSGQGVAPAGATAQFYKSQGLERIPTGPGPQAPLAFTVPGIVDAFISLLERYGTKPVADVLAPAIHYAEQGIPNYEYMLDRLRSPVTRQQFDQFPPGGAEVFYHDGELPRPGSLLVQPGLANTLKVMAQQGSSSSGSRLEGLDMARQAFYKGSIARTIVESSQSVGGILGMDDLAAYRSQFGEPTGTTFRGYEVFGHQTWTQGPMLMQTLNVLEGFDLKAMGHNSPAYIHTVTEALKLAFADREAFYGDPDYSTVPLDGLVSKEYAATRAALIDAGRAYPEMPPHGDPWAYSKETRKPAAPRVPVGTEGGDGDTAGEEGTTHVAVLDQEGNMVCGTISGGAFAKSVFFPDLGCALSTRIEMFNCEEGHPNVVEPGKRPRTTLINYIVCKDGQPLMTVGCPGGDNQVQANLQILLNHLIFDMDAQEAVEAPRFGCHSHPDSFYPHSYYPGSLRLEAGIPEATAQALQGLGHQVERTGQCGMGATLGVRDPETKVLSAGGDPRRACYAIGL
ncbi:MAG: hypothetical protein BZY88_18825 [SAR202 cluster bacterium Io17-Chloro-G9]|nr:MAG: hypothetical protein BZY88_18825 [SAR202 cluster bacterium Io17-Chloro-G9]